MKRTRVAAGEDSRPGLARRLGGWATRQRLSSDRLLVEVLLGGWRDHERIARGFFLERDPTEEGGSQVEQ